MTDFSIREGEKYIKLGQLLKACDMVSSGVEAKIVINEGFVTVNGEVCEMRGKKIYKGDIVNYKEKEIRIV